MNLKKWNWGNFKRAIVILGTPAIIIWLGGSAINHISELYYGLCPVQGAGMGKLLFDDNPKGYCTGIGSELSILGLIMGIAAIATTVALVIWWNRRTE